MSRLASVALLCLLVLGMAAVAVAAWFYFRSPTFEPVPACTGALESIEVTPRTICYKTGVCKEDTVTTVYFKDGRYCEVNAALDSKIPQGTNVAVECMLAKDLCRLNRL